MKKIGSFMLGIVAFIVFGIVVAAIVGGIPWIADKLYPITTGIVAFCLPIVILLLPFAFIRKLRPYIGTITYASSYIFGLGLWVFSAIVAFFAWGYTGLIVGLFLGGIGVVPIAFIASIFKGMWSTLGDIVFGLVLTYGSRLLGVYIVSKAEKASSEYDYEIG